MEYITTPTVSEILREEFMEPLGISAYRLAQSINVPVSRVQDILHDRRKITADTSLRLAKFFGVSDGAYLSTDVFMDKELSTDHSYDRMEYLFGRIDTCASDFYNKFQENEEELGNKETAYMSNVTKAILSLVDYESIKGKRTENFQELNRELNQYNKIKNLNHITGAYMYPLLIEDGANVRKYLQERKIYISMLWPNVIETEAKDSYEYYLAQNILPIPCDQRYDSDDMKYIATMIKKIVEVQE